jgi:hypothetical protein
MLRISVWNPIGTSVYCDIPSLLTTPPLRTTPSAVSSDCLRADALHDRVGAVSAGQLAHPLDALLAAFGDHVGGAEVAAEVGVAAHHPS